MSINIYLQEERRHNINRQSPNHNIRPIHKTLDMQPRNITTFVPMTVRRSVSNNHSVDLAYIEQRLDKQITSWKRSKCEFIIQ